MFQNPNSSTLIHMQYSELNGVGDYDDPEAVKEIQWIVAHSSYAFKYNWESGIYDYIFNLSLLDIYAEDDNTPANVLEQLTKIKDEGFDYILFHQGC